MATYRIDGVKYNPANWSMLEKTERAACARFAARRERELNTIETNEHICAGGPFHGAAIELQSMASAPIHVGAWVGHYEAVNTVKGCGAVWVGTNGGQAINTHGNSVQPKAAPEVTGKGFDQLRDLLAELGEDPAERATESPLGPRAVYTIGRARYTIAATPEAVAKLRAKLLKAKKWFADKCLPAPAPQRTASDQVADVVAVAMAAAAIDAAQESAAAAELLDAAEVSSTQAEAVADAADLAEVAEPVAAMAADVTTCSSYTPNIGTPGHGSTGMATPTQRSSAPGTAAGQRIAGKSGQWVATFHTTAAGLPGMHYTGPDGHTQDMEFETGSERMRTLQAMAREADAQKQQPSRAIAPHELDPMECTASEAQAMTETEAAQAVNYWEGLNYHTHALALLCLRAGRDDLADECRRIEREHMETGCLGWELNEARQAVAQALKATPATHTPHPTGTQATQPAGVCPAGAPNYTDPLKTLGIDYTQPLKTLAVPPATPTDWQSLVGAGVTYTGDACNAPGNGAIVAVHETPCGRAAWLTVDVMLEDGRHPKGLRLNAFGDKPGYRYRLRPMLHGAPYLAQLAAAVAMREANRTATKAMADKAHADDTARLAVEFAHLERAENNHRGGTFAARNIRTELKRAFQGVKFSVTSDYSSVRVKWTDGPTDAQVNEVIGRFSTGASDTQSDYFYTVETAFSKLFGGVQYLFTDRNTSEAFTADVLAAWWPTRGESATQPKPTAQDWKRGEGLFSWRTGCDHLRGAFRKHLRETAGPTPTPAKATRKAKA